MTKAPFGLACLLLACSNTASPGDDGATGGSPTGGTGATSGIGTGGTTPGGSGGGAAVGGDSSAGTAGSAGATSGSGPGGSGGAPPTWGIETRPTGQTCVPPATRDGIAMLLSATGCVDPMDPKRPAATLIPYAVSSPLWSDAASKGRFFALPDDAMIDVKDCTRTPMACAPIDQGGSYEDEGDWTFPVGTVFVKTFGFGDDLHETRLLVRAGEFDFWGYSYRWSADQTDATLVSVDGEDALLQGPDGMLSWHFPGRAQCLECHTTPAGVALGLETSSLNTDFLYPNGVMGNQLETLEHIGVFAAAPARRRAFPNPADEAAPLAERARSYLHANCSMCHRPGSNFTGFDARFTTPFEDMTLCNEVPEKGDLGVTGALRITPGDAASSVVSLRMHTRDLTATTPLQMPRVGTNVVDEAGVGVIDAWINSLTSCP